MKLEFHPLTATDEKGIEEMSALATAIVKEHFDPIIGAAQNDYMIRLFQSADSIRRQLEDGARYYFVCRAGGQAIGFMAFYPKEDKLYLSKFYLCKTERGQGLSRQMLDFLIQAAKEENLPAIYLNVNRENDAVYAYKRLGFRKARQEVRNIGNGFVMDDDVYEYRL